jgi:hypothetical protein
MKYGIWNYEYREAGGYFIACLFCVTRDIEPLALRQSRMF